MFRPDLHMHGDRQTQLQQAMTLHRQGQAAEALRICREILHRDPGDAQAHNLAGASALTLGDLAQAETAFRAALSADPELFEARANLGQLLALGGDLRGAEAAYRQALEQRPDSVPLLNALGLLLARSTRRDEALQVYEQALALDPESAPTLNNMGATLVDLGRNPQAIEKLQQALQLAPNHVNAMCNLAIALKAGEQPEEALDWCDRALALQPDNPVALNVRGGILHDRTELEAAATCYRAAIDAMPNYVAAHNNLGNALKELGQHEEAIREFRSALGFDPGSSDAQYNLASLYQTLGDFEAAIRNYGALLDRNPDMLNAYNGLQSCLLHLRRAEDALKICKRCRERFPANQFSIAHEAFAAMQLGDEARFDYLYPLDRFPHPVEIDVPEGFGDLESLNQTLARDVLSHPSLKAHHDEVKATTTRRFAYGILESPTPAITAFAEEVRRQVRRFMETLPADPEHPFSGQVPPRFELKMWATVLSAGGIHGAHNHEHAWLSGVYYVQGSDFIKDDANDKAGWIEFDGFSHLSDAALFHKKRKVIEPQDGLMLFFPAYFLHGTVPFHCDETRISIAFDVQPRH